MNPKTFNKRIFLYILFASIFFYVMLFGYNCSMDLIWQPTHYIGKIIYMAITTCMWLFFAISSAYASDWLMKKIIHKEWKDFDIYIK